MEQMIAVHGGGSELQSDVSGAGHGRMRRKQVESRVRI